MTNKEDIFNDFIDNKLESLLDKNSEDFDNILDERDEAHFSDVWISIYNEVKIISEQQNIDTSFSEKIREKSFRFVISRTQNSDLAAYISDDLGLLSDALNVNYNNNWLVALWKSYLNYKIPHGELKEERESLTELFNKQ